MLPWTWTVIWHIPGSSTTHVCVCVWRCMYVFVYACLFVYLRACLSLCLPVFLCLPVCLWRSWPTSHGSLLVLHRVEHDITPDASCTIHSVGVGLSNHRNPASAHQDVTSRTSEWRGTSRVLKGGNSALCVVRACVRACTPPALSTHRQPGPTETLIKFCSQLLWGLWCDKVQPVF